MLIRHTLLYLPAQLVGPLFQFVAAVLWTHWMAPDAYGVLAFVLASQELAFVCCLSWWSQFALRYLATFEDDESRDAYQQTETVVLAVNILAQGLFGMASLATLHVPMSMELLAATAVYVTSRSLLSHLAERARAQGQIGAYTITQLVGLVAGFGLAYALVAFAAPTPANAIAGLGIANAVVVVWLWVSLQLGLPLRLPRRAVLQPALAYGLPLVVAGAIGWVSANGIRVIVEHVESTEAVGLVSVGWGLGQRLGSVVAMLVTAAAFPLAVKHLQAGRSEAAIRQLSSNSALLLGLLAPATAGLVVLTPLAVELMIAAPFREVTNAVLPVAMLAASARNFRIHFVDQVFILFENTGFMVVSNVLEAVLTVAFCWAGLVVAGLAGAALGCLVATICVAGLNAVVAMRMYRLGLPALDFLRIFVATAIMTLVLRLVPWDSAFPSIVPHIVAEVTFGGLCYVGVMALAYAHRLCDLVRQAVAARAVAR